MYGGQFSPADYDSERTQDRTPISERRSGLRGYSRVYHAVGDFLTLFPAEERLERIKARAIGLH